MADWRVPGGSGWSGPSGSGWQQEEGFAHNLSDTEQGMITTSIAQHQAAGIQPTAADIARHTRLDPTLVQAYLNEQHAALMAASSSQFGAASQEQFYEAAPNPNYPDLYQADPAPFSHTYPSGSGSSSQQVSSFEPYAAPFPNVPVSNYSSLAGAVDLRPTAVPPHPPAGAPSGSGSSQAPTGSGQGIYKSPGGTEYNTDPAQSVRLKSGPNQPPNYAHLSTDEKHSRLLLSGQQSGFDRPGRGVRAFDHIRPEDVAATVEGMRRVYRGAMDKRTAAQRRADPQGSGSDHASD